MAFFQPTYGWPVHILSTVYCFGSLILFAAAWVPASLLLELPLRFLFSETLLAKPESFLNKKPGLVGKLGLKVFRDDRDWFKIYYTLYVSFVLWPAAIYMTLYCNPSHCLYQAGIYYTLVYGPKLQIFINMFGSLHTEGHIVWKQGVCSPNFAFLNHHLEYAFSPVAGQTPLSGTRHVKIHHTHTNRSEDTDSLIVYNRLSGADFIFKYLPDMLATHTFNIDGFRYFAETENWRMWKRLFRGTACYVVLALAVVCINPLAAVFVVAIPLSIFNMFACASHWSQHCFLYEQEYEKSITVLLDTDVYAEAMHLSHHQNPNRNPFDHRDWFETWKETDRKTWDAEFRPFVFKDLDNLDFLAMLLLGRTKALAEKFVNIGSKEFNSRDEIEEYLKQCTQPVAVPAKKIE